MSEVYWLGGADQAGWQAEISRLGVRPAWIEEVHWVGMEAQPGWLVQAPAFSWPPLEGLEARLAQDAARLILSAERSLVLLAAPGGAALLASPRAVGRLNLVPAVRLEAWGALPAGSTWQALSQVCTGSIPMPAATRVTGACQILYPPARFEPAAQLEVTQLSLPIELLEHCAELRQEIHEPAELLWQLLDGRQINQVEFSRRQELDGQILDFYCPQAGLVVLIDHRSDTEDARRMHVFAQHGLRVLRFWNSQVIEDTPEVLQAIWQAVSGESPAAPAMRAAAQTSQDAPAPEMDPSAGGIEGLNELCRRLKAGERGLLVQAAPAQPVLYLVVERL
jgi:very-short-patch-repair endonuclease